MISKCTSTCNIASFYSTLQLPRARNISPQSHRVGTVRACAFASHVSTRGLTLIHTRRTYYNYFYYYYLLLLLLLHCCRRRGCYYYYNDIDLWFLRSTLPRDRRISLSRFFFNPRASVNVVSRIRVRMPRVYAYCFTHARVCVRVRVYLRRTCVQ